MNVGHRWLSQSAGLCNRLSCGWRPSHEELLQNSLQLCHLNQQVSSLIAHEYNTKGPMFIDLVQFYSRAMTTYFANQTLNIVRHRRLILLSSFYCFLVLRRSKNRCICIYFHLAICFITTRRNIGFVQWAVLDQLRTNPGWAQAAVLPPPRLERLPVYHFTMKLQEICGFPDN